MPPLLTPVIIPVMVCPLISLIRTIFPLYKRLFFNQCFLAGIESLSFLFFIIIWKKGETDRACTFVQEEKGMHHFNEEYLF